MCFAWFIKGHVYTAAIAFRVNIKSDLVYIVRINNCSHCTKKGHKNPMCGNRRGAASLRYRKRAKITVLTCDKKE